MVMGRASFPDTYTLFILSYTSLEHVESIARHA